LASTTVQKTSILKKQPLLSIVIPTKNRYEYLVPLLDFFHEIWLNEIELIIQDNSDNNDKILKYLNKLPDIRIKYQYTSKHISIVENCDLAIDNANGKYVIMIGDDDGILPTILEATKWMDKNGIDALANRRPHYLWPDIVNLSIWNEKANGILTCATNYSGKYQPIDLKLELNLLLSRGCTNIGNLPRVYHMIISKNILEILKDEVGTYFPGPSPDMANAIGLSKYIKNAVYIDYPLVITGNGYKSTGGQGVRHSHHGILNDLDFLPKGTVEMWSVNIPKFWSGPTIYAESAVKALQALADDTGLNNINYAFLYAHCLVYECRYWKIILSTCIRRCKLKSFSISKFVWYFFHILVKRAINFIVKYVSNKTGLKSKKYSKIINIQNIKGAAYEIQNLLPKPLAPWE
jgi:glycosyltransferase involved in cell wall biosynthesis